MGRKDIVIPECMLAGMKAHRASLIESYFGGYLDTKSLSPQAEEALLTHIAVDKMMHPQVWVRRVEV